MPGHTPAERKKRRRVKQVRSQKETAKELSKLARTFPEQFPRTISQTEGGKKTSITVKPKGMFGGGVEATMTRKPVSIEEALGLAKKKRKRS